MTAGDNLPSAFALKTVDPAASVALGIIPEPVAVKGVQPKVTAIEQSASTATAKTGALCVESVATSEACCAGSTAPVYAPSLISGILVISGWIVVNKAQANRERRKQIREFGAGLMKDLTELEKSVIEYHTNLRDTAVEQALISKLARFEKACGLLPRFVASQRVLKAASADQLKIDPRVIQRMRKAMTLEHFSDEHDEPISNVDPLIQGIEIAASEVQEALESVRLAALD